MWLAATRRPRRHAHRSAWEGAEEPDILETSCPTADEGVRRLIGKFVDVGFSKFVVLRPVVPRAATRRSCECSADGVLDLQT